MKIYHYYKHIKAGAWEDVFVPALSKELADVILENKDEYDNIDYVGEYNVVDGEIFTILGGSIA